MRVLPRRRGQKDGLPSVEDLLGDTPNWMPRRFQCQRETILHWLGVGFGRFALASPTTPAENPMVKTKLRGLAVLRIFWSAESSMSTKQRVNGPKRRGQTVKAQSDAGLAEVARATSWLWRKQPQNASVLNGGFRLAVVSTRINVSGAFLVRASGRWNGELIKNGAAVLYKPTATFLVISYRKPFEVTMRPLLVHRFHRCRYHQQSIHPRPTANTIAHTVIVRAASRSFPTNPLYCSPGCSSTRIRRRMSSCRATICSR